MNPQKIYIIHGWTYTLIKWQKALELLKQAGFEPIMLKVPGLTTQSDEVWDIDKYVVWLENELKGVKQPIVLGHSNGGRIALAYLQKHPGAFSQLILEDSAGIPHESPKLTLYRRLATAVKPIFKSPLAKKIFYKLIGASDYHQAPPNMKRTMQNVLDADKDIDPSVINVPTTIIWGDLDKMTPMSNAKALLAVIPGAQLELIHGAKHSPHGSHPEEFVALVSKIVGDK